ncbi:hypothetical protein GFY24_14495 [Nocardia sp. SYP-A9097]|uniref:YncE family protein n=1 Tax=Nocardia sp. SYP-A9097 TaxID=2663237 RepID=UPI00129B906C|nr:YncE family protein [Nocardia sp. SYP-A9097]MRH88638.1 hypothetical protein [Nocardia sp. SYP-A9097]
MQQPFDQRAPYPEPAAPNQSAQQSGPGAPIECTYVADSTTALRLSRAMELARWRSPRTWVMVAVLPLVIMSRHIFDLITGAGQAHSGVFGILGVYFALLVLAVVIVALITGVRMMKRNPLVTAYASAGMPMGVRYSPGTMEVSLASEIRTIDYPGIKDVAFFRRSVFIRPENGHEFAIPRELVPEFAAELLRSGGVGTQIPSGGVDPATPTSARTRRQRWVVPVLTAAAVIAIAVGLLTTIGIVALKNDGDGRTSIATNEHAFGGDVVLDAVTRTLYVTNKDASAAGPESAGTLSVVDLSSNTVTATVPLPTGTPQGIALDSSTRTVYVLSVSNYTPTGSGVVTIIDAATNTVTATVPIDRRSFWLAVDESTHTTYVLNETNMGTAQPQYAAADSLSVIPPGSTVANAPVPTSIGPKGIVIDSHTAYVANLLDIQVIDLATNKRITSVPLPFTVELMLADHDTRTICAVSEDGRIAMIDARSATVTKTLDGLGRGSGTRDRRLEGLAFDSAANTLYLSSFEDNTVTAIDTVTGEITDTLSIRLPYGIAVDPRTHTLYAYSAGKVVVIPRKGS